MREGEKHHQKGGMIKRGQFIVNSVQMVVIPACRESFFSVK